jgi:hypothetical protein
MSLVTNLGNLATRVATEVKAVRTLLNGNALDNSALTTTAKANLVVAINEVVADVEALSAGAAGIDDLTISTTSTWSSDKTNSEIVDASTADRDRANHTGTQSADTLTDGTTNKAFLATERTKLTGIATGATANSTDAQLRDRATHTGTQSTDTLTDGTTSKVYTATEKTKLAGIATGATANATDAQLRDRATHTGLQAWATISDGPTEVGALITAALDALIDGAPTALDTLNELAAAINDDAAFSATVTTALGNRVRTDTAVQGLDATQQSNARTNIAAASAAALATLVSDVGDTTTNFVTIFEAGL